MTQVTVNGLEVYAGSADDARVYAAGLIKKVAAKRLAAYNGPERAAKRNQFADMIGHMLLGDTKSVMLAAEGLSIDVVEGTR